MSVTKSVLVATSVLVSLLTAVPRSALACCALAPPDISVQIADQEVLIVWDAKTKTEHFIRRADFTTSSDDFGFLVPTPTVPELAEVENAVFERLARAIEPEVVEEKDYRPNWTPLVLMPFVFVRTASAPAGGVDRAESVRVLHEQRVAGYDAVVLEADDANALVEWLGEHGYTSTPATEAWVRPYVDARWKLTAFRYAAKDEDASSPSSANGVSTGSIRMSFSSERPFFPYRVPSDQLSGPKSLLRVYFVGDRRIDAALEPSGGASEAEAKPWHGETKFAAPLGGGAASLLGDSVPTANIPANAWLMAFEDAKWPGGVDDLWFSASKETTPVRPPPIIRRVDASVPVPLDVVGLVIGLGIWVVAKRPRKDVGDAKS